MKLKILRNLGADWPSLVEGQEVETGKDIDREVGARLAHPSNAWLAEVIEPDAPPESKAVEIKAIPPQVEKPIEGRTKGALK